MIFPWFGSLPEAYLKYDFSLQGHKKICIDNMHLKEVISKVDLNA